MSFRVSLPLAVVSCLLGAPLAQAQYGRTTPVRGSESAGATRSPLLEPRRLQLTGHVGFAFGGGIEEADEGSATLEGGPALGAIASYTVRPGASVRLLYAQQENGVQVRDYVTDTKDRYDLHLRSLQIGGAIETPLAASRGRLWPYFALSLGATQFDPDSGSHTVNWTFSWMAETGFTFWLVRYLGITALLRLQSHVLSADTAAFCVSGEPCRYLRSTTMLWQGEIGGGITLAL